MSHAVLWEKSGATLTLSGEATLRAREAALHAVCSDRRFDDIRFVIVDYLNVTEYEIHGGAIEEMAALQIGAFRTNPKVIIASVATQPAVIDAVEKMIVYQFISAPQAIFQDIDGARNWIAELLPK